MQRIALTNQHSIILVFRFAAKEGMAEFSYVIILYQMGINKERSVILLTFMLYPTSFSVEHIDVAFNIFNCFVIASSHDYVLCYLPDLHIFLDQCQTYF